MHKFKGTGTALVTPFDNKGAVDYNALERLITHVIEGGVEYLVVMGTTAENPVLDQEEKTKVLEAAKEANAGKLPLVYGIGGNNTEGLIKTIESTDLNGVDGSVSVSPYYNKPTQEGIYQHYKALAEKSPVPIIIYNVPGRTSSNITAETTLRLARDCDNIIGVKEASGDMVQVMDIIHNRPDDFLVISGEDNLTLPIVASGGDGVISVSGQAFPTVFSEMVLAALAGDMEKARHLHYKLFNITKMLFAEGNPGGVKAALSLQQICGETLRLPLWNISNSLRNQISEEIERQQL